MDNVEHSVVDNIAYVKDLMSKDRFAEYNRAILTEVSEGYAVARMKLEPFHLNGLGVVHGAATFTVADFAFAAACNSYGSPAVSINNNMCFIKGVKGKELIAEAREVSRSRKIGNYEIRVTDDEGDLVAVMQGVAYRK